MLAYQFNVETETGQRSAWNDLCIWKSAMSRYVSVAAVAPTTARKKKYNVISQKKNENFCANENVDLFLKWWVTLGECIQKCSFISIHGK